MNTQAGMQQTASQQPARIVVNGAERTLDQATSVAALVQTIAPGALRLAVELNGGILPRSLHAATWLQTGDRLEIVYAVGGG